MRVTEEMKVEMKRLHDSGLSYVEIGRRLGVTDRCVRYWLDDNFRERYRNWLRGYYQRNREKIMNYVGSYLVRRYHSDSEFRQRYLGYIKKYANKIAERNRAIKLPDKALLKCPYCSVIWKPLRGWIPLRCPKCRRILVKLPVVVNGK